MDILTIIGAVFSLVSIVGGAILKGAGVQALLSGAAFTIVVVGSFGAVFTQTTMPAFKHALKILIWVLKPPHSDGKAMITEIVEWSNIARKQGLLGLEAQVEQQTDDFIKKGLQLLVDGAEPEAIRNTLEIELSTLEHFDLTGAKVFETLGIYAPTMGLIGAVLGLMAVMKNLNDPSKLGAGIAAAFTATVYGIASANLMFLPAAGKIKSVIHHQVKFREMIIEGFIAIARGENPRNIESKLQGFLHH